MVSVLYLLNKEEKIMSNGEYGRMVSQLDNLLNKIIILIFLSIVLLIIRIIHHGNKSNSIKINKHTSA